MLRASITPTTGTDIFVSGCQGFNTTGLLNVYVNPTNDVASAITVHYSATVVESSGARPPAGTSGTLKYNGKTWSGTVGGWGGSYGTVSFDIYATDTAGNASNHYTSVSAKLINCLIP